MTHVHHAALGSPGSALLSVTLVLVALLYLRGWLSLRPSCLKTSAWSAVSFLLGLFLVWVAITSPIAALDHELLTVHMLQHLLLMTLAPPLIWLGSPVRPVVCGLAQQFVERMMVSMSRFQAVKRLANTLGTPQFAWLAACAALVGWHIPSLFALGMRSASWHWLEQLSFLATGLLFWRPVVQPSTGAAGQDLSMILYLFFATLPCDILSGVLVFSDRVVYPTYFSSSHLLGFSPLVDQQCAAALMWTCVTIVYFVAGAILTIRILSPRALPQASLAQQKVGNSYRVSQTLEAV